MPNDNTNFDLKPTNLNMNNVMDLVIQGMFAKTLTGIFSNMENFFSLNNIGVLLFLISLPEIKKGISNIYNFIKDYLYTNIPIFITYLINFYKDFNFYTIFCCFKKSKHKVIEKDNKNHDLILMEFNKKNKMMEAFLKYAREHSETCYFDHRISLIKPINFSEYTQKNVVSNFRIESDNLTIIILNDIIYFTNQEDEINSISSIKYDFSKIAESDKGVEKQINLHYPYYLPARIHDIITNSDLNSRFLNITSAKEISASNKRTTLNDIAISYNKKYPTAKISHTLYILNFLTLLNIKAGSTKGIEFSKHYIHFRSLNFAVKIDRSNYYPVWDMSNCEFYLPSLVYDNIQTSIDIDKVLNGIKSTDVDIKDLPISLNSNVIPYKELGNHFKNFLLKKIIGNYANQYSENNKKINVYNLFYKKTPVQQTIPNPLYDKFMNRVFSLVDKNENADITDEDQEKLGKSISKIPIPSKTIEVTKDKFELDISKVSTQYKDFSTLYLRKEDKFNLENMLRNFKNADQVYDELGIRKKLGILLYGVPGTGKSTTINAIASYLKRDIYYVNLKGVNTNSQLQETFDYVLKNCANKGLIVIEEIEKQTPIVFRSESEINDIETYKSLTSVLTEESNELDLSYLLNILDGTISQENTVFIMTTNHIDLLEPALYRSGRVDVCLEFKKCNHYQIDCIFNRIIKHNIDQDVLNSIPENVYTPADIIFEILQYLYHPDATDAQIMNKFIKK
ncbi:MAG: hypothetical protein CMF62_03485 [Magnetococcales bacterium]|nr:hypothetical protein [Magnetococcales bacterium]|tara:strand:- start:54865 stop:57075 length:2211 start_codon:yes stop_codon:yes gene_type:complete